MGLRQKSRGIRFGPYEYVAVAMALLTTVVGIGWWIALPRAGWLVTPARVAAVSMVENTHAIEASRPKLQLHFEYVVAGRVYGGQTRFDRITQVLYGKLPGEIRSLLRSKGYLSFKDLPPDLQRMLRHRGVSNFDHVPVSVLNALRAQGYNSVREFPDDVVAQLRAGNYEGAARAAGFNDERIAALAKVSVPHNPGSPSPRQAVDQTMNPAGGGIVSSSGGRAAPIAHGTTLRVRYNPLNPTEHEVIRLPYAGAVFNIGVFLALAFCTLSYSGVIYPKMKQG